MLIENAIPRKLFHCFHNSKLLFIFFFFFIPLPHCLDTSRKPKKVDREKRMYAFTSRSKMEADIKNGRYLEHGEYDGNLYGLKIDSIHEVVEAGRVCILDANPEVETNASYCR